jgi:hypothetical protein
MQEQLNMSTSTLPVLDSALAFAKADTKEKLATLQNNTGVRSCISISLVHFFV